MKNKIGLLGLLAVLLLVPVLTTGCPTETAPPSKAAELTSISVEGVELELPEEWIAISPTDYEAWLDDDYDITGDTVTVTLEKIGIAKPYTGKVTATVSKKAKATFSTEDLTDPWSGNSDNHRYRYRYQGRRRRRFRSVSKNLHSYRSSL